MAKKKDTRSVTAKIRGVHEAFKTPTTKQWTRYVEKARNNKMSVGKRELLQTTCVSHKADEIRLILNKSPAAIGPLTEGVEELAGGDVESSITEEGTVLSSVNGSEFKFASPEIDVWESFQDKIQVDGSRLFEELMNLLASLCDDADDMRAAIAKSPGAANVIFDDVSELAGTGVSVVVKKG